MQGSSRGFVLALDAPLKFSLLKEEREAGGRFPVDFRIPIWDQPKAG